MKKNKMMRIASVLLVAALISTCAISGTFAKYVTSGEAEDTAYVAKWGVKVIGDDADIFSTTYAKDDDSFKLEANTVISSDGTTKIVAPGTEGSFGKFSLTGTPEVATRVTFSVEGLELSENWLVKYEDEDVFYCPIEITVAGNSVYGLDYASADDFIAAVEALTAEDVYYDFRANKDLSEANIDAFEVSWKWYFEDEDGTMIEQRDEWDTYLGDQAAAGNAAWINITLGCTVTQID